MLPTEASASSAVASAAAPSDEDALLEESLEDEEEEEEEDEPDEPELEEVEADEDAVEDDASPELSVVVCEAVSQAATKKATATSAIRRCNMVMLPGLFRFNMHPGYRIMVPARPVILFKTNSGLGHAHPCSKIEKQAYSAGTKLRKCPNSGHLLPQNTT